MNVIEMYEEICPCCDFKFQSKTHFRIHRKSRNLRVICVRINDQNRKENNNDHKGIGGHEEFDVNLVDEVKQSHLEMEECKKCSNLVRKQDLSEDFCPKCQVKEGQEIEVVDVEGQENERILSLDESHSNNHPNFVNRLRSNSYLKQRIICGLCQLILGDKSLLLPHAKNCHQITSEKLPTVYTYIRENIKFPFYCLACSFIGNTSDLQNHYIRNECAKTRTSLLCKNCKFSFCNYKTNPVYTMCTMCDHVAKNVHNLIQHLKDCHEMSHVLTDVTSGEEIPKTPHGRLRIQFLCRICSECFESVSELIVHKKNHESKIHVLNECDFDSVSHDSNNQTNQNVCTNNSKEIEIIIEPNSKDNESEPTSQSKDKENNEIDCENGQLKCKLCSFEGDKNEFQLHLKDQCRDLTNSNQLENWNWRSKFCTNCLFLDCRVKKSKGYTICNICKYETSCCHNLILHLRYSHKIANGKGILAISSTNEMPNFRSILTQEMKFLCRICDFSYAMLSQLAEHVDKKHNSNMISEESEPLIIITQSSNSRNMLKQIKALPKQVNSTSRSENRQSSAIEQVTPDSTSENRQLDPNFPSLPSLEELMSNASTLSVKVSYCYFCFKVFKPGNNRHHHLVSCHQIYRKIKMKSFNIKNPGQFGCILCHFNGALKKTALHIMTHKSKEFETLGEFYCKTCHFVLCFDKTDEKYTKCTVCTFQANNLHGMIMHLKVMHKLCFGNEYDDIFCAAEIPDQKKKTCFFCRICLVQFNYVSDLACHIQMKHQVVSSIPGVIPLQSNAIVNPLPTDINENVNGSTLDTSLDNESEQDLFLCGGCNELFAEESELKNHKDYSICCTFPIQSTKKKAKAGKFLCSFCDFFGSRDQLREHLLVPQCPNIANFNDFCQKCGFLICNAKCSKSFTFCTFCKINCINVHVLICHLKSEHDVEVSISSVSETAIVPKSNNQCVELQCRLCQALFANVSELCAHVNELHCNFNGENSSEPPMKKKKITTSNDSVKATENQNPISQDKDTHPKIENCNDLELISIEDVKIEENIDDSCFSCMLCLDFQCDTQDNLNLHFEQCH